MLKAVWKDPVWSAVIAAGIVAAAGLVATYALDLWPAIGAWARSAWIAAGQLSQAPNWLVWVLALVALPTVLAVIALGWLALRPEQQASTWRTYTQDEFLGLRWRWNYFASGNLEDPLPFCPGCDYQVHPHHASAYAAVDRIGFYCDSCSRNLPTFEESFDSLQSKVRRFIQQRIRTGDWKSPSAT